MASELLPLGIRDDIRYLLEIASEDTYEWGRYSSDESEEEVIRGRWDCIERVQTWLHSIPKEDES